jgi:mono/diheme cytochrome c family protein
VAPQVDTWAHIGLVDPPTAPAATPLPVPEGGAPLEARARAYLHANCSICHRPGGTGQGAADFSIGATFADMHVCDVTPTEGDLGVADARLLAPGAPARSTMSLRMHTLDPETRMPALATHVVDPNGTRLIDAWISAVPSCSPRAPAGR